jgi:predicted amidophosphoribosyltransferase
VICGLPFPGVGPSHPCPRCLGEPPAFDELRTWGLYRGGLLDAIQRWKFGRDLSWRAALEALASEAYRRFWQGLEPDVVVPVPCHPATLRRRGFDPAALLSRAVARRAAAPWRPRALRKLHLIPELVGLDARERWGAVQGAYGPGEALTGTVVLVDDVVTSTATARACAAACRRAGAARVLVLGLARTPLGPAHG